MRPWPQKEVALDAFSGVKGSEDKIHLNKYIHTVTKYTHTIIAVLKDND